MPPAALISLCIFNSSTPKHQPHRTNVSAGPEGLQEALMEQPCFVAPMHVGSCLRSVYAKEEMDAQKHYAIANVKTMHSVSPRSSACSAAIAAAAVSNPDTGMQSSQYVLGLEMQQSLRSRMSIFITSRSMNCWQWARRALCHTQ